MNEDNFSVVKYLYTMDNSITAKNATVPDIIPFNIPERASISKSYIPILSQVYDLFSLNKSVAFRRSHAFPA